MLNTIGVKSLDDLFKDVPAKHRFPKLDLPAALTEMEAASQLADIAASNENVHGDLISFLGAGDLQPLRPFGGGPRAAPGRVLHRLHPVPTRDLAGDAASDL